MNDTRFPASTVFVSSIGVPFTIFNVTVYLFDLKSTVQVEFFVTLLTVNVFVLVS